MWVLLPDDVLRFGVVGKRITRYGGDTTVTASSLGVTYEYLKLQILLIVLRKQVTESTRV